MKLDMEPFLENKLRYSTDALGTNVDQTGLFIAFQIFYN